MNRVLPLLLGLALVGGGCAMTSKSYRRNHRRSYGPSRSTAESVRAYVNVPQISRASTGSTSRYRPSRAPRRTRPMLPSPASSSSSDHRVSRRSSGGSGSAGSGSPHRRIRKVAAKVRATSGRRTPAGTTPAVARGARVPMARLVIYQGPMVLRVFKLQDAADLAQKLALETGAYIQSRHSSQMVIRVPVNRFHELMARLSAVGEVAGKSIAARDVTRQYFDVTYRLKADYAVLTRLKSLLLKVRNVKESLLIEREMGRLLTRIEQYKGLLRYLRHHASLSTIKLHFRVKPRYSRRIRSGWRSPFGWVKRLGIWRMMRL